MTNPKPEPKPKPANGDDMPPLEEKRRCSGEGGFVFLCALAGHTEVRSFPVSLKIRSIATRSPISV
jgi:F-box/WD-40 domain protein 7